MQNLNTQQSSFTLVANTENQAFKFDEKRTIEDMLH